MNNRVRICEMSPRDGMQALNRLVLIPIGWRIEFINALLRARFPYIEVGSFVSKTIMPSMADTHQVLEGISKPDYDLDLAALVPNEKHYERFKKAPKVNTVALFVAASEYYSMRNKNILPDEDLDVSERIATDALQREYRLRSHLSAAFRTLDPEQNDPTDEKVVLRMCKRLLDMGCKEVTLADTDGNATFEDVERVVSYVGDNLGYEKIGLHLHNRHGMAIIKAKKAYDLGVRIFDAAVGGIGGNRRVVDAVGNIATSELLHLFEKTLDAKTEIDSAALKEPNEMVSQMSRFVSDQNNDPLIINLKKIESFGELERGWDGNGAFPPSEILRARAERIVSDKRAAGFEPEIFPTSRQSIQLEYRKNGSYLEIEVFVNKFGVFLDDSHREGYERKEHDYHRVISEIQNFHES